MGSEHGFWRLHLGNQFVAAMSRGASYTPPPAGSAYHMNFREDTAWQGTTLLGGVSELLTGTLRLSGAGLEVQDGDDYEFVEAIRTMVSDDIGSVLVTGNGITAGTRIVAQPGTKYVLAREDANTVAAWNAANYLSADAGSGDFTGDFKVAIGFTASARSLVMNDGTVATDANSPDIGSATNIWLGGDGGSNSYGEGFYYTCTWYDSKLSDAALKALTA